MDIDIIFSVIQVCLLRWGQCKRLVDLAAGRKIGGTRKIEKDACSLPPVGRAVVAVIAGGWPVQMGIVGCAAQVGKTL